MFVHVFNPVACVCSSAQDAVLEALTALLEDPACSGNPVLKLVTGMVYAQENNHIEALRCCHQASTLEMYVCGFGHVCLSDGGMGWRAAAGCTLCWSITSASRHLPSKQDGFGGAGAAGNEPP